MKPKKKPCKDPNNTEEGKLCYYFTREFGCDVCTRKYKPQKNRAKKSAINKVSKKQQKSNKNVTLAKAKVMAKWIEEHNYIYCSSCGTVEGRIDFSHLIPISDNKALEADVRNILPQCGELCHPIQERGSKEMVHFNNYEEIMRRIKEMDEDYYRKLIVRHS